MTTTIPVSPFRAEFCQKTVGGPDVWHPCEVVGIHAEPFGLSQFIVMMDDEDGVLYPHSVDAVRRTA